ncbi:MAG: type II toxin-antitoxin system PemK/MazF family toxin [Oscillospiraceae bacterium]|nr:type II toxin-antitoxin system PemK/MazF family toxin [Oscillospiraceae bacterium]
MVGKIYTSVVPYYDVTTKSTRFKGRPVLIIGDIRNDDYTVLPISKVSKKQFLDLVYDVEVKKIDYPNLKLTCDSYIRVHKQTTVHKTMLGREISDLKYEYEDLYLSVFELLEQRNNEIMDGALS